MTTVNVTGSKHASTESARDRVMRHALTLFCVHGYHGASMRDIADAYGVRVSALYNHFKAKEDVLFELLLESTRSLATRLEEAEDLTCSRQSCRLQAWVEAHAMWDLENQEATIMNNHEFRHLPTNLRPPVLELRDKIESDLQALLSAGIADDSFKKINEVKLTANAIFAINRGIADWYDPGGRLTVSQIASEQANIALHMVGATPQRRHSGCTLPTDGTEPQDLGRGRVDRRTAQPRKSTQSKK